MVSLVLMNSQEIDEYFDKTWQEYFQELIAAGTSEAEAKLDIERNKATMFESGKLKENHRVFNVVQEDSNVGILWLGERTDREWFIYDISVSSEFRGQGLGKATMQAAEDYVRNQNGTEIGLSVFGNNLVARKLYESLDYQTVRLAMKKTL